MRGPGPDGVADYPCNGVFRMVEPNARLVMTCDTSEHGRKWHELLDSHREPARRGKPLDLTLDVSFAERAGKTTMTVTMRLPVESDRDASVKTGAREGWSQSFERLEALLATARA